MDGWMDGLMAGRDTGAQQLNGPRGNPPPPKKSSAARILVLLLYPRRAPGASVDAPRISGVPSTRCNRTPTRPRAHTQARQARNRRSRAGATKVLPTCSASTTIHKAARSTSINDSGSWGREFSCLGRLLQLHRARPRRPLSLILTTDALTASCFCNLLRCFC